MSSSVAERKVAITGVGLASPLGNSKQALAEALSHGRSGVRHAADLARVPLAPSYAAPATEFSRRIDDFGELEKSQKRMIRKGLKMMCRETAMGVMSAQAALRDANFSPGEYPPERCGCIFGTDYMLTDPDDFIRGINNSLSDDGKFDFHRWGKHGMPEVNPLWLLLYLPNMPASHIAIYNDFRGPNNSITLREAAANAAIGEASFTITRGHASLMVAGATGTRIHPMNAIHALQQEQVATNGCAPEKACRPFDLDRTGMVLGEGAGVVVLEEFDAAQKRGARIYGEVVAWASSSVSQTHQADHRRKALANVLEQVLERAKMNANELGHLHAHGLSTSTGDQEEAQAIRDVLKDVSRECPVTAAKSYFGNLGAGSGLVELICSLLALRDGHLFPILNYETPDPACPVAAATSADVPAGKSFVSLSVSPQGQASAVLVRAV